MPTIGTVAKPGYIYDADTDTWIPIGVGAHTHSNIQDYQILSIMQAQ